MLIEILESGEMSESKSADLSEEGVYILLDYRQKRSYIWSGQNSSVRKRFVAAKEASRIMRETGFQNLNVQLDEVYNDFEKALKGHIADIKNNYDLPLVIKEQKSTLGVPVASKNKEVSITREESPIPEGIDFDEVLKHLTELEDVKGKKRDYVVASGKIYAVENSKSKTEYKPIESPKEGVFEVSNYHPRFYLKEGKLLAIELWRNE